MGNTMSVVGMVTLSGFITGAVLAQTTTTGPAVKPAAVTKKAGTPPPATATKSTTAGKNKTTASTKNSATDDDSFWVEKLDVDGDGDVEDTNLIWDDEDGVLFAYTSGAFACKNGGTATADLLIATNAAGNPRKRPAGSGFWVADLDAGECGAQAAGLWGCRFDATGTETACGVATIDDKTDDIVIVAAKR